MKNKKKHKLYVPLHLHLGKITIDGEEHTINLPQGCKGILFAFETKKSGRAWQGKKCEFITIEERQ